MTIREIGGIRGIRQPMKTVGKARISRNVDLIAYGGGIGRRCAAAPPTRRPIGRFTSFLYDCTFLRLLFVRRISIYYLRKLIHFAYFIKNSYNPLKYGNAFNIPLEDQISYFLLTII